MLRHSLHWQETSLFISLFPVDPTRSIGHPWNVMFHFSFLVLRVSVGLLGRGISSSQGRYLHRTTQAQNKRRQTSMPWVGFEPMIPAFERAKTVHALDRTATVIQTSVCFIQMLLSVVLYQSMHRVHSDLDAVTARIYSCWNYGATNVTPTQKHRPPLVEDEAPFRNTDMSRREQKSRQWISRRNAARNDCAGEDQPQFNRLTKWLIIRMEAGSSTSTIALRVVGGEVKGTQCLAL
jgi:hypothetical protein